MDTHSPKASLGRIQLGIVNSKRPKKSFYENENMYVEKEINIYIYESRWASRRIQS
jgi:hypothetical protein